MDLNALPDKTRAKLLEYPINLHQNTPEAIDGGLVIRCVLLIEIAWNRVGDLAGERIDLHFNILRVQHRHKFVIETGHGPRDERHRTRDARAGIEKELVINEVERDLKASPPGRERPRSPATRTNNEGRLTPVVDIRMKLKLDHANNLHPHVYRTIRILPLLQRQSRPQLLALGLA